MIVLRFMLCAESLEILKVPVVSWGSLEEGRSCRRVGNTTVLQVQKSKAGCFAYRHYLRSSRIFPRPLVNRVVPAGSGDVGENRVDQTVFGGIRRDVDKVNEIGGVGGIVVLGEPSDLRIVSQFP
jgi:hypothetical protein